jgi:F-type H+-transporting ATPase subunit epsilon
MAQLEVDIVDADGKVWSGEARQVTAPAADGEIGILPGHTPVLALLRAGEVRITEHAGSPMLRWRVDGGFLSVDSDQVTIVVDDAQPAAGEKH